MTSEDEEIVAQILSDLAKNDKKPRSHANFFEFWKKSVKETGIFEEFIAKLEGHLGIPIKTWKLADNDPPDVIAELENGQTIGVELTELVNKDAIDAQIHKPETYTGIALSFGANEALVKINSIIDSKSNKLRKVVSIYDQLILLIHTDEIMLTSATFVNSMQSHKFHSSDVFNSVHLMFSYEPASKSYPVISILPNKSLNSDAQKARAR